MHEIIETPDRNLFGLRISDTLTDEDYDTLVPFLQEKVKIYDTARFCFVMDGVDAWEPEDRWEDLTFDVRHTRDIDKVAVVSDEPWEPWIDKLEILFPEAEINVYESDDEETAWTWLRGDMDVPGIGPGSVPEPDAGAQDEDE
jgi:hypothetical protein